jgi:mono/diheme cytochrome c family protein
MRTASTLTWTLALCVSAGACAGDIDQTDLNGGSSARSDTSVSVRESGGSPLANLNMSTLKLSYRESRGGRLFDSSCAVCHGPKGEGDGFNAFNLDPRPRDLTDAAYMQAISDQAIREVITQGGRGMNKSILMPAYGQSFTKREIDDLVAFVRSLATAQEKE